VFETGGILRGKKKSPPPLHFKCYSKDNGAFDSYRTFDIFTYFLVDIVVDVVQLSLK
jgi:hypothetical protein